MDRDKLREKIVEALMICDRFGQYHIKDDAESDAEFIVDTALLAPVLADAEKWGKVRKIFFDCSPCTGCTGCDIGSSESCKMVIRMNRFIGSGGVDALEGEGEKG